MKQLIQVNGSPLVHRSWATASWWCWPSCSPRTSPPRSMSLWTNTCPACPWPCLRNTAKLPSVPHTAMSPMHGWKWKNKPHAAKKLLQLCVLCLVECFVTWMCWSWNEETKWVLLFLFHTETSSHWSYSFTWITTFWHDENKNYTGRRRLWVYYRQGDKRAIKAVMIS